MSTRIDDVHVAVAVNVQLNVKVNVNAYVAGHAAGSRGHHAGRILAKGGEHSVDNVALR